MPSYLHRLRHPRELAALIRADDLIWPDWVAILELAWRLAKLETSPAPSPLLAPVRASDAWDDLHRLSLASRANEPPGPTGEAAFPALLQWGSTVLRNWPFESASGP